MQQEQKKAAYLFALNELVAVLQGLEREGKRLSFDVSSLDVAERMVRMAHDKIEESGDDYREQLC